VNYYNEILVFHILSFLSWFAMLFYLPRLFVYHAENREKSDFVKVVKIMEYKLIKYIGNPAMWATIISGTVLIYITDFFSEINISNNKWLFLKLLLIFSLFIFQIYLEVLRKKLSRDICEKSGKFFRILNEFPTLISIFVVYLVIVKPF
jgi:putative membrane protein